MSGCAIPTLIIHNSKFIILYFYAGFFLDFAEGGLEEGLAGFDLPLGEVPAAVALDEEHF